MCTCMVGRPPVAAAAAMEHGRASDGGPPWAAAMGRVPTHCAAMVARCNCAAMAAQWTHCAMDAATSRGAAVRSTVRD